MREGARRPTLRVNFPGPVYLFASIRFIKQFPARDFSKSNEIIIIIIIIIIIKNLIIKIKLGIYNSICHNGLSANLRTNYEAEAKL